MTYFDVIVRYARYLPNNPDVYKNILISFLDGRWFILIVLSNYLRGIRHPHQTLRSRAAYLLSRFVKSQIAHVAPFVASIMQSLMVSDLHIIVSALKMMNPNKFTLGQR